MPERSHRRDVQVPANLTPGTYNVYVDAMDTTPLPGNGPNDSQSAEPVNCPAQTNVTRRRREPDQQRHAQRHLDDELASSGQVAVAIGPAGTAGVRLGRRY